MKIVKDEEIQKRKIEKLKKDQMKSALKENSYFKN